MIKLKLISAMVTPFDDNNKIDYEVLEKIIDKTKDYHDGYLIAGSTGEGDSLSSFEVQDLIYYYMKYNFTKILNISMDCTDKIINYINSLYIPEDYILLIRVPSYYLSTQNGMIKHFIKIFKFFPSYKFMIYDIPKRTGSILNVDSYKKILENTNNLIGIKDCTNDFKRVKELSKITDVYSGNDDKVEEYIISGALGHISVFSIVEKDYFINAIKGIKVNKKYNWNRYINPIGIKSILKEEGFPSMNLRLPLSY